MSWLSHDWIGAKHVAPYISLHERCLENSMEELTFHQNQPSNQPLLPILCGSYSGRSNPQYIRSVFWCSFHLLFYPSGKRLHNELERSTVFNGKIHYFDWAMASIANCWHNQRVKSLPTRQTISWSAKIGVLYDKNFGSARIIWPWKLHLLASSMKILDAKRRECGKIGWWWLWLLYVTMDHSPILYVQHQEFAVFPHAFPMSKGAETGQRHQRNAHAAQHGPYCPARCLWREWVLWEKPGEKSDQKMKHVGDCW